LLYIDAPEMPGHCRPGRVCVDGDPYAAKAKLQELLTVSGGIHCKDEKKDVYGRRLAFCSSKDGDFDLSQEMLNSGLVGVYEQHRKVGE
jgi:endonuclease YncB( thermonuclease family)